MRSLNVLAAIFSTAIATNALADSPRIQNTGGNNHFYQRFDEGLTWQQARAFCVQRGGYLATVTSEQENNFVYENLISASSRWVWLGGSDELVEGSWEWVNGDPWVYENWLENQPDNACEETGGEDYLHMFPSSPEFNPTGEPFWNDENNDGSCLNEEPIPVPLCEWDDETVVPPAEPVPAVSVIGIVILSLLLGATASIGLRYPRRSRS